MVIIQGVDAACAGRNRTTATSVAAISLTRLAERDELPPSARAVCVRKRPQHGPTSCGLSIAANSSVRAIT